MKHYFNQTGRSMIEMLGVLAIVGVLSIGGIAGYTKAMLKYKATKLTEQIITLNTNISTLFAHQKSYKGLDTAVAIDSGIVPADMMRQNLAESSSAEIFHVFGGNINFFSATRNSTGDNLSHIIIASKIPNDVCVQIVTTNWGEGKGRSNFAGLMIVADNRSATAIENIISRLDKPNHQIEGDRSNNRWAVFSPYSSQKWRLPATITAAAEACNYDGYATVAWKYN